MKQPLRVVDEEGWRFFLMEGAARAHLTADLDEGDVPRHQNGQGYLGAGLVLFRIGEFVSARRRA